MSFQTQAVPYSQDIQGSASRLTAEQKGAQSRNADQLAVLRALAEMGPSTPDEVAARLGRDHASLRPRFTELANAGRLILTGETRRGTAGGVANVWRLTRADEVADAKNLRRLARLEREKRRFAKLLVEMGVSI